MKTNLVFLLLLAVSIGASAQKIVYDHVDCNGIRNIKCSEIDVNGNFTGFLYMSMSASNCGDSTCYYIDIETNLDKHDTSTSAPVCARTLFKNRKGDVIVKRSVSRQVTDSRLSRVEAFNEVFRTIKLTYEVTQEEIDRFVMDGVEKIRIELNSNKTYDYKINKKNIDKFFSKEYKLIQEALTTEKSDTFEDDF